MSGGSLDYVSFRISEAANKIQQEYANIKLRYDNGIYETIHPYDKEHNPDDPVLADNKAFTEAILKQLQAALVCVRNAVVYTHEFEWWNSGDTGAYDFVSDTKKQCKGNREAKGIV